jgi:uncharacterized protein YggU (UPF0235/DUF167 family)
MDRKFQITSAKGGAAFAVRVVTRSDEAGLAGTQEDGALRVRLTASDAGDPEANRELVGFFAELLGVKQSNVEIVAGQSQRDKLVCVLNVSSDDLEQKLGI